MTEQTEAFEGWAILELMGHRRLAGYVTEVEIAGCGMLALMEAELFAESYIVDWDNSVFVGDRPEDEECAKRAGIMFVSADKFFGRSKYSR